MFQSVQCSQSSHTDIFTHLHRHLLGKIHKYNMCRPQCHRQNDLSSARVSVSARKVVKKYRKMSLKREMRRLRRFVVTDNGSASRLSSEELLDRTVSLIEDLESRLMTQLRQGNVPEKMRRVAGVEWGQVSIDFMREVLGGMMEHHQ